MDTREAILRFLGIQGVKIEDVKIFQSDLRVEVKVRQKRADCFCRSCGTQYSHVHEWVFKKPKAPPLGIYSDVTIKFYQLRGWCVGCGRTGVSDVSWIHPKFESMTCSFAEVAGRLMEETSCAAVSRILKTNSKLMWSVDQWRMQAMLERMQLPKDIDVTYLCADEVHFRTVLIKNRGGLFAKRFEPLFVTNLVVPKEGKVLFNALGRGSAALISALNVLSEGQKLACEYFAVDMHDPYIAAIKKNCPNAKIVIDRFHLAEAVNKAFDKLRRHEFTEAKKNKDKISRDMLEPHRRFVLMSRDKDYLSKAEVSLIDKLRYHNKNIHAGMLLVELFHKTLDQKNVAEFKKHLLRWYMVARNAKLRSFLEFAKLLRKYRRSIETYIVSKLTTAVIEGLNNKIKTLRRVANGYTNPISYPRKILQRCGYLNHRSINTDDFFFKVPHPV